MNENSKLMAIAVLCVTAVLLTCTLVIMDRMPVKEAYASGPGDRAGDYVLIPGASARGADVVYVIDGSARKLVGYYPNLNSKRVDPVVKFDLAQIPQ